MTVRPSRSFAVTTLRACVAFACFAPSSVAQTIDELRQQFRDAIGAGRQAKFLAGFIDLSETPQLSAGSLRVSDDPDLDIDTFKLPWNDVFPIAGSSTALRVEAGLGYFVARSRFADLWSGTLQGGETTLASRWEGVSGYLGIGPRFDLGSGFHLSTIADVSLSYLENQGLYGGPGASFSASLFDGILFNWHSTSYALGTALLLEHEIELGERTTLRSLARYDLRWFDALHSTDSSQDVEDLVNRVTLRTEMTAPTGLSLWDAPLQWAPHVAYSRFLGEGTGDGALGFLDYFEVGAGLISALPLSGTPFRTMQLAGSVMFGEGVRGWSLGFSLAF